LVLAIITNISLGSVDIPFEDVIDSLLGGPEVGDTRNYIVFNYRLPKAITAVMVGSGLAIGGLFANIIQESPCRPLCSGN